MNYWVTLNNNIYRYDGRKITEDLWQRVALFLNHFTIVRNTLNAMCCQQKPNNLFFFLFVSFMYWGLPKQIQRDNKFDLLTSLNFIQFNIKSHVDFTDDLLKNKKHTI